MTCQTLLLWASVSWISSSREPSPESPRAPYAPLTGVQIDDTRLDYL